ncbi:hypothetical protein [Desulfopila aestuarii]|uniref:hypothetical protein n=1 Tax=Desulfopila aestuarii TaxID=231440 RepID=UPI001160ECAB|nr:hypothetical protein [Desulfopila aestuarii]
MSALLIITWFPEFWITVDIPFALAKAPLVRTFIPVVVDWRTLFSNSEFKFILFISILILSISMFWPPLSALRSSPETGLPKKSAMTFSGGNAEVSQAHTELSTRLVKNKNRQQNVLVFDIRMPSPCDDDFPF